jgi:branched-chain amino acid transport system ATP-binding protein
MLRIRDLKAGYGTAPVLQGVSLHVGKGETVALLGPNGAGKSTVMAAITGTIRNRQGTVLLDESTLVEKPSHAIVSLGVALVPEGRLVFPPFTVEDNLRLGAMRLKGSVQERFDYVYGLFPRLAERRKQAAGTLSGGEQQMLAIGRALMARPRLLMLDEPSMGIAPILVQRIYETIGDINRSGVAILLVEQNANYALDVSARGYVLETGHVALTDTSDNLRNDERVQAAYLGA